MTRPLPEGWAEIKAYFAWRGSDGHSADGLEVLEALEKSREIYGHNFAGRGYLNNQTRARLMKAWLGACS